MQPKHKMYKLIYISFQIGSIAIVGYLSQPHYINAIICFLLGELTALLIGVYLTWVLRHDEITREVEHRINERRAASAVIKEAEDIARGH